MNNNSNSINTNINKKKMDDPNQGYETFNQKKNRKHRKQHHVTNQKSITDPKTINVNHYHCQNYVILLILI